MTKVQISYFKKKMPCCRQNQVYVHAQQKLSKFSPQKCNGLTLNHIYYTSLYEIAGKHDAGIEHPNTQVVKIFHQAISGL